MRSSPVVAPFILLVLPHHQDKPLIGTPAAEHTATDWAPEVGVVFTFGGSR